MQKEIETRFLEINKDKFVKKLLSLGAIDIDTWPKIPVYAEIEGASVKALKNFCKKFDLDWEKRFDGDAREVFRHYGYDLDKIDVITFNEFK